MERLYDRGLAMLGSLAGLIIAMSAIGIGIDVIARYWFGFNLPWLVDVIEYGMVAATFCGAPWLLRNGDHVSIDFTASAAGPHGARLIDLAANAIGFAVCATITIVGLLVVVESAERGSIIVKATLIPEWWILSVVPFGIGLCAIEFLRRALLGKPQRPADDDEANA